MLKNEKRKKERKIFAYSIEFVVIKEYTIVVLKKIPTFWLVAFVKDEDM